MTESIQTPITDSSPSQTSTDASKSSLTDRIALLNQLNEADAEFARQLGSYSGGAARWSIGSAMAGGAVVAYPVRKHLASTVARAEKYADELREMVKSYVIANPQEADFSTLADKILKPNLRTTLNATGQTLDPTLKSLESLFHQHRGGHNPATGETMTLLRRELASCMRNSVTRGPFGFATTVLGSALAAGAVGHIIYKATHPHQRQEVMELARECRRLEELARSESAGSFEERLAKERQQKEPETAQVR